MNRLIHFIIALLFLVGCSKSDKMEVRVLKQPNPTSWTFPVSKDSLRNKIIQIFSEHEEFGSPTYRSSVFMILTESKVKVPILFRIEWREVSIFFKDYFAEAKNRDDLILRNDAIAWASPIYFSGGEPLPFRSSFAISFDSLSINSTRLNVTAINPTVIHGFECCGPHGRYGREIAVDPTTIEEYTIILLIGEQLGIILPPLVEASDGD